MSHDYLRTSLSPMNKSISKQLYSFAKSTRFNPTPQPLSKNTFYEIKRGAFGDRTTTFGYGNKMEFSSKEKVPPVGNYEHDNQFSTNKEKKRGYSFGTTSKQNILVNPQQTKKIPGPGAYKHTAKNIVDKYPSISFSMRQKTEDPLQRHQNKLGPGQYETISGTSPSGKYFVSRFTNSACRKIGREKRSELANRSNTPGPGQYRAERSINLDHKGVYFNSKVKNMEANRFSKTLRPSPAEDNKVPGPGSYFAFSEFAKVNRSWMKD